jgi:hypothetical protein
MKENTPLASLIRNERRTLAVFQFFFAVLLLLVLNKDKWSNNNYILSDQISLGIFALVLSIVKNIFVRIFAILTMIILFLGFGLLVVVELSL